MKNKIEEGLTKQYRCSIMYYNYIFRRYSYGNYEIYKKMCRENKNISWAYNVIFLEAYQRGDKQLWERKELERKNYLLKI